MTIKRTPVYATKRKGTEMHPRVQFISDLMKKMGGVKGSDIFDMYLGTDRDAFVEAMQKMAKSLAKKMPNAK